MSAYSHSPFLLCAVRGKPAECLRGSVGFVSCLRSFQHVAEDHATKL